MLNFGFEKFTKVLIYQNDYNFFSSYKYVVSNLLWGDKCHECWFSAMVSIYIMSLLPISIQLPSMSFASQMLAVVFVYCCLIRTTFVHSTVAKLNCLSHSVFCKRDPGYTYLRPLSWCWCGRISIGNRWRLN